MATLSLRGEVWTHQTSKNPLLLIEVPVPSQENEWSCIAVIVMSLFFPLKS